MSVAFTSKKVTLKKTNLGFVQSFLSRQRERELPIILRFQSKRSTFLDWYFFIASVLGEEIFFITFIPFCCWNVSRQVALHLTFLLALSVGGGNMLKNFLQSPRPPHKLVWVNKSNPESDSGFPSTHTMTAFTIPWYLLIFYWETTQPKTLLMSLAVLLFWSLSIATSRVYNGHHFIVDVVGGFVLSLGILTIWTQYLRYVLDPIILYPSLVVPAALVGGAIFILYMHPQPPSPNPAIAETALVVGTCTGTALGVWTYHYGQLPTGFGYKLVDTTIISGAMTLLAARFVIGVIVVALVREFSKRLFLPLLFFCYYKYSSAVLPSTPSNKKISHNRTNYKYSPVDTALKFLTYTAVSFAVVGAPHLCCMLGLFHESDLVVFVK